MAAQAAFRIALAAAPWPVFNRPSLQLGILKSYAEEKRAARVDTFHLYLPVAAAIGVDRYARIAASGWAGEALFAPLLFPEMRASAERLFYESLGPEKRPPDFAELVERIEECCTAWVSSLDVDGYRLFGFSVCFFQLLSSIYLARLIKGRRPELPIVFGGSSCAGQAGVSLLERFAETDFVIDGEGEESLCALCRFLAGEDRCLPANIRTRQAVAVSPALESLRLDELPLPDYGPYFQEMRRSFPELPFIPVLPIEFSRGCWWRKCTFCNLNLQWQGYRFKSGEKMAAEIVALARSCETLHFAFADNALPPKEADLLFARLADMDLDLRFFAETRTMIEPWRLQLYRRGGLDTIQMGIEALSTSLLEKMAKGTTVMDIMAAMKSCSENGIRLDGNLITEFPTATAAEIAETLRHLDYVLPFAPLQTARFFLGYGSPIQARPREFAIRAVLPHAKYRRLLPERVRQSMVMLTCGYSGERLRQRRLWRPVHEKIRAWREYHRQRSGERTHPLSYRDGKHFLIIRQERLNDITLLHKLRGLSRRVYLFCGVPREKAAILAEFPMISRPQMEKFLAEMFEKRLMFLESERVLALAVRGRQE